ncbi:hypothetical protein ABR737_01010 [Streptomyces sp. Edi2]|uniref:hypothetical protein n=1 Tax=Streptomyces sp. Edi2 TaxID=3162528 RepID=UPI0033064C3F
MTSSANRIAFASATAAAAVLLTACSGSTPIKHGLVKDKRGHAARPDTPIYSDTYRQRNCRNVTTNAAPISLAVKTALGGSRGGSFGGSRGGGSFGGSSGSRSKPSGPKIQKKPAAPKTRRVCDRVFAGRVQTDVEHHPAVWELKLKDGDRIGWKKVSKKLWNKVHIGDKI